MSECPTTHWSFITDLRRADGESRVLMVEAFLTRYLPPMRAWLRHGFPNIDASDRDDLIQDFVTDRVIQRSVLDQAQQSRGRLRSFLAVCLANFARTWLKRQARARGRVPLAAGDGRYERTDDTALACRFDIEWARHAILEAVDRMRTECDQGGKPMLREVFETRLLRPMLYGVKEVPYLELSRRLGVAEKPLANLLTTAKRRLRHHVLDVIGDYAGGTQEAEEEVGELFRILAQA